MPTRPPNVSTERRQQIAQQNEASKIGLLTQENAALKAELAVERQTNETLTKHIEELEKLSKTC
jgi:hypothetical protein